ncbi:MAG TPA: exo-beta-N-acetylmuramidase NamZ domain-containing protein [Flavitalea sp.]|nr:exo-beta-N-acetylmuramidase NamZ domain-containing protein [Flavitalea sp.]
MAVFANPTSVVGSSNLVDTLFKKGVNITVIFGPEHGFRGTADAGEKIDNVTDPATQVPVVSLYGKKRKPSAEDFKNVDVMLFDIQDVEVRFYTYISSLQEYLDSAVENDKPVIIPDRPQSKWILY